MKTYFDFVNKSHPRFATYQKNKLLYEGKHREVFNINQFEYFSDPMVQYLSYNFTGVLTDEITDLIWGENPIVKFKDEKAKEFFDNFKQENNFFRKMREMTQTASHAGESVGALTVDTVIENGAEKGVVRFNPLPLVMWFPIFDPMNPSDAQGHIKYHEEVINPQLTAILLEVHTAGKIEWVSYKRVTNEDNSDVAVVQVSPLEYFGEMLQDLAVTNSPVTEEGEFSLVLEYETTAHLPLIFHIPNLKTTEDFFGVSDYTEPLIAKVFNTNFNMNQIQYVLKKHAHPKMVVPASVMKQAIQEVTSANDKAVDFDFESADQARDMYQNKKGVFENMVAQKLIEKLEFIPTSKDGTQKAEYLTWDASLNESREQIKLLRGMMLDESKLSKVLIDPDISLGNMSGVAIQRLAQRSLLKARAKIDYLKESMRKIIFTAIQLHNEANSDNIEAEYPSIEFKDGLIDSVKEIIEEEEMKLNNALTTKVDAIARINAMTEEQAQEKANQIEAENNIFNPPVVRAQATE